MKSALRFVVAVSLGLASCRTAYHVVTAPVRVFHHPRNEPATSDVVASPGAPVAPPTPTPVVRRVVERNPTAASPTPHRVASQPSPKPNVPKRNDASPVQFPMAKAVPNKPGYVFSPSDPTKYVDVSGYPAGSKVKDPYSGKIFLVP